MTGTDSGSRDPELPPPVVTLAALYGAGGTSEQVVEFADSPGMTTYHAVGSAAMGPDDDDVVAPDLRVRGVDGLRVADISVLPQQVAGNTAAQAMAIGWLGADVIRSS